MPDEPDPAPAAPTREYHYVLRCPCGTALTGDTEDDIVDVGFAHLREAHPEMAEFYGELVVPESDDEAAWRDHALGSHITYNHATGTCRLGPATDPLAVVGPDLRVHGFDNLWLADMSVIPVIPHAPTNLTAYLVGSVAARNLLAAGV